MADNDVDDEDLTLIFKRARAAHHGRDVTIRYGATHCVMCEARTMCLAFDSSEGEYGAVRVCEPCLRRLIPQSFTLRL